MSCSAMSLQRADVSQNKPLPALAVLISSAILLPGEKRVPQAPKVTGHPLNQQHITQVLLLLTQWLFR